jgi:hypothetical protein
VKSFADRFPVGTRYVIEGRTGAGGGLQVFSRFVQYPDGAAYCCHLIHRTRKPSVGGAAAKGRTLNSHHRNDAARPERRLGDVDERRHGCIGGRDNPNLGGDDEPGRPGWHGGGDTDKLRPPLGLARVDAVIE